MQKPDSMKKFDMLFWTSILVSFVNILAHWEALERELGPQLGQEIAQVVIALSLLLGMGLNFAIWFLVSVKRIGFVRYILVALGLYGVVPAIQDMIISFGVLDLVNLVYVGFTLLAFWMLFRPDSNEWFAPSKVNQ